MPATSTAPVLLSDLRVGATARFHDAKLDSDMTRFLRAGEFDPTPVITHRFPMDQVDAAVAAIKSGEAGKVIFEIA